MAFISPISDGNLEIDHVFLEKFCSVSDFEFVKLTTFDQIA